MLALFLTLAGHHKTSTAAPSINPEETEIMPRQLNLETPTARLKLKIRKKPYRLRLGRGLSLDYRRNQGAGAWSTITPDGRGGETLKRFGAADDRELADGKEILSYSQAVDIARKLTKGADVGNTDLPPTLKGALAAYEADLIARGASAYNARWPAKYLPAALLGKSILLLDANELRRWRDSLLKEHAPATVNRLSKAVAAALNLAATHDHRITNRQAWRVGLQGLPDANRARNCILSDAEVRALIAAAYAVNDHFGLFIDVLAVTGARPSQAARLEVGDLRADELAQAKVLMPKSAKGGGRNRVRKKIERTSVPITPGLATRLKVAAAGRSPEAPLLLWRGEQGWGADPSTRYRDDFRAAADTAGLDPSVTLYSLRHSSIVRQLLAGVPIRLVAVLHNTSVGQIESNYSKHIAEHSDVLSRRALLADEPPIGANVISMAR